MMNEALLLVAHDFKTQLIDEVLKERDGDEKQLVAHINKLSIEELLVLMIDNGDFESAAEYAVYEVAERLKSEEELPF